MAGPSGILNSDMEKIVFLERNTFRVEFRRPDFDHEWTEHSETWPNQVVERLREATIAICNKLPLQEAELSCLPRLKLIAVAATGVDNIDLAYCRSHGIAVSNTRNYAGHSLPEHVLMLMLTLRRNLVSYREDVKQGRWHEAKQFCLLDYPLHDLHDSTMGIIGYGFLGQAIEKLGRAVGMRTLISEHKGATTIRARRTPFAELLRQSDVVSLHCPLTAETRSLIGAKELGMMKPSALLVNTARGGLVDEAALVEALKSGVIAGAAFDVLSAEPPRQGSPLLELDVPNLIVTPHVAWASNEAMQTLADQLIENLEAFVSGKPKNLVA
jgi:glycerate dehydrogenase